MRFAGVELGSLAGLSISPRLITINKPALRVRYNLVETNGSPTLEDVLKPTLAAATPRRPR